MVDSSYSYVIGGRFINLVSYDGKASQVRVDYTNGGWTIIPNIVAPFFQWLNNTELALWNLISNSPAPMFIPLSSGVASDMVNGYVPVLNPRGRNLMVPINVAYD